MKRLSTIRAGLICSAALVFSLSACVTLPPVEEDSPMAALLEKARAAEDSGSYAVAAREYLELAGLGDESQQSEQLLNAAEAFYRGNFLVQAKNTLASIPAESLGPQQVTRRQTLIAAIAVSERDPHLALNSLKNAAQPATPAAQRAEIHQLRAMAYTQTGDVVAAARERAALAPLLSDPEAARRNNQLLWQSLLRLPPETMNTLHPAPPPDAFGGWVALLRIAKLPLSQSHDVERRLIEWRRVYPHHPASEDLIASLMARQPERLDQQPAQIALLLPFSGGFTKAAEAVRDGFLAAYYQAGQSGYQPRIRLYDSGENPADIAQLYARAVTDGAEFVVGPLSKEAVTALRHSSALPVPVLALNYSDDTQTTPARFFQFGLAPEDEARQVAERAWLEGHTQAVAIVPAGDWGMRVVQAFESQWQQLGSRVVETQTYEANENDFSVPLRRLLNIDDSENRARTLRAVLQRDIKFETRRRQDTDFVFMAAFPRQARQIPPQLKFFYAGDLPIYATSHIYEGRPDSVKDRDLDGVNFTDIPWLISEDNSPLRQSVEQAWPNAGSLRRLHALGADAFQLIPYLDLLRGSPHEEFMGATGRLTVDGDNRVHRTPVWARFIKGEPRRLSAIMPSPPAAP